MVDAFPDADILCLWNDAPRRYANRDVRETWIARTPLRKSKLAALPFILPTWRRRTPENYDWALVSSHLFAHHVSFRQQPESFRKYVYVHSPARYLWNPELDARGDAKIIRAAAPYLRAIDHLRAQEAYAIAANSRFIKARIEQAWDRESVVIYPPVDVERIQSVVRWAEELSIVESELLQALPRPFVLGASRFVRYKRLDRVIAAGEATGTAVVLAGSGPDLHELQERAANASVRVAIVESPSDALLYALYQEAMVYVFPAVEDFGIMPVEAMAAGAAVVVPRTGGASESVVDGVTGSHCDFESSAEIASAVGRAASLEPDVCANRARVFGLRRFEAELVAWVAGATSRESTMEDHP